MYFRAGSVKDKKCFTKKCIECYGIQERRKNGIHIYYPWFIGHSTPTKKGRKNVTM